jgi:hypothetical protein
VHAINNMHGYCYLCLMVALFVFFLVAFLEEISSIKGCEYCCVKMITVLGQYFQIYKDQLT